MTAPIQHRAVLRHRQVLAAAMKARSRAISVTWIGVVLGIGLILAIEFGHAFAFWLVQQLPFSAMFAIGASLPTVIPALFALIVVIFVSAIQNWAIRRAYLANFRKLGIPTENEALFEVLPEGLRLSTDRITIFPGWQAIDTVQRGTDGWVISSDQLTFLIPNDSFPNTASERFLVAGIIHHLTEAARARSPEALAFVAAEANAPA